jgi:hypothetical protein
LLPLSKHPGITTAPASWTHSKRFAWKFAHSNPRSMRTTTTTASLSYLYPTGVVLGDRPIAWYSGVLPQSTNRSAPVLALGSADASLRLPPGHRRVEFEFAAAILSAPVAVRARFTAECVLARTSNSGQKCPDLRFGAPQPIGRRMRVASHEPAGSLGCALVFSSYSLRILFVFRWCFIGVLPLFPREGFGSPAARTFVREPKAARWCRIRRASAQD